MPEPTNKPRESFSINLVTILGGQAACALLGIVIEIFYARALGTEGRGQISLCLMAISVCVLVGGLGVEYPALIWAAERTYRHSDWFPGVLLSGVVGCVMASSLWVVSYWYLRPAFLHGITPAMGWLVLTTIPCAIFFGYLMAIIAGQERFRLRAVVALSEQIASLLAMSLLFLVFGRKVELAVTANLLAIVLGAGICLFAIRDYLRVPSVAVSIGNQMRSAVGLGLPAIMGNLATFFNYRLDVFIVNYFLNPSAVGIYSLGVVVSEALWQVPRAMALALFPRTARSDHEEATRFTCLIVRQVFLIASVTGILIALVSPILIPMVFGKRFAPSVNVIWWILPGTITLAVAKIMCADLAGRKKGYFASIFAFLSFLLTIALDTTLIPRYGINGAAIASSSAYLFNSILLAFVLQRELKVSWKILLIPQSAEWSVYFRLWSKFRALLLAPAVTASSAKLNHNEIT